MINYSSLNDAWGKKEIYKKKPEQKSETTQESLPTKQENFEKSVTNPAPTTSLDIKKDIFIETPFFETFQSCNMMEHITNCPECVNKLKEMFSQPKTITLPGCNIKISKDVLQVIFVIIIICIILLILSIFTEKNIPPAYNKYMYMPYY